MTSPEYVKEIQGWTLLRLVREHRALSESTRRKHTDLTKLWILEIEFTRRSYEQVGVEWKHKGCER